MSRHRESHRIPGLSGLRAIACLAIVFYHMLPQYVPGGFLAVNTFFVLSGFLMAETTLHRPFHLGHYLSRRVLRIYPALLVLLSATLGVTFLTGKEALAGCRPELLSVVLGYNNIYQIVTSADYFTKITGTSPFTHLWTIALELQFYVLWPFLLLVLHRSRKAGRTLLVLLTAGSCAALVLETLIGADLTRLYYGTDTRLFSLTFGALLADRRHTKPRHHRLPGVPDAILGGGLFVLFLYLCFTVHGQDPNTYLYFLGFSTLLAGAAILLCGNDSVTAMALESKTLCFVGSISYEIYLVMYPVLFFLAKTEVASIRPLYAVLSFLMILVLATLLHVLTMPKEGSPAKVLSILLVLALLVPGCLIAYTAPSRAAVSADQEQLKKELEENAAMLEKQKQEETAAATAETTESAAGETAEEAAEEETTESSMEETTETATETSTEATPETVSFDGSSFTFIGDSVMLGASPSLLNAFPGCTVDAVVSRQVWDAKDVIDTMRADGTLGSTVVIGLGANGPFTSSVGKDLLDDLSEETVYWILPYGRNLSWEGEVCDDIRNAAAGYDNVTLIDWPGTAKDHPEWFYDDGMHLNADGQKGYAEFLLEQISGQQEEETSEGNQ
ncbi:MAG: acyltransferase family protein [Lachnospiraceae bacterium]|jgi:peptidoglycan/LPS O-acetylase OafA/YrhL/Tfp pilus assembly protein PilE